MLCEFLVSKAMQSRTGYAHPGCEWSVFLVCHQMTVNTVFFLAISNKACDMFPLSGVQVDFAFDNSETRTIHNLYILIIVWTNPNNILPMNKGFLCEELFGSGKTLKFNNFF